MGPHECGNMYEDYSPWISRLELMSDVAVDYHLLRLSLGVI